MPVQTVDHFDSWRDAARAFLAADVPPSEILWQGEAESPTKSLFGGGDPQSLPQPKATASRVTLPKKLLALLEYISHHRDPGRWELMYRVVWRITHGERHLMKIVTDADTDRVLMMERALRRDAHKCKAFVRFRRIETPEGDRFVAWHRPDHFVLGLVGPFFARRFHSMHWTILTPDESAIWDGEALHFGPGAKRQDAPTGDELEDLWKTYYRSTFNPARLKVKMMKQEMPVRHWATLPEAELIEGLIADASRRVRTMVEPDDASPDNG